MKDIPKQCRVEQDEAFEESAIMSEKVASEKVAAKKVQPVPETILKRRKRREKEIKVKSILAIQKKKRIANNRTQSIKRAEKYVLEYRQQERDLIRMRREARSDGSFFKEPEARLAFVIRIRGINGVHPKVKKILQLLRLRQIHNGVFVKINEATLQMLRLVQPYIAWGYPSLKSVRNLVYKRGFAKINGSRIPIADNLLIETHLGKKGIVCMEDVVHELYTVGHNFKYVSRFLWPFKLNSPKGGLRDKGTHFVEGGDNGNRENKINGLIAAMN